jgi:hypothetical protein
MLRAAQMAPRLRASKAYEMTLFVGQRGPVHCAGQVVFGEFTFAARIDEGVEVSQACDGGFGRDAAQGHGCLVF